MKALSRTAAIRQARQDSRIERRRDYWQVVYWRSEDSDLWTAAATSRHAAQTIRAQILIDTALHLMGLTAEIQYMGGDWTAYIPREQK